jgi:phenylalanyl-tRNA synthetase beta chain
MKFSENWLRAYVNPAMTTEQVGSALTMAGFEVESLRPVAPAFSQIVVAQVLDVKRHPNADKLSVCRVNTGIDERMIVCGAPNVAAGIRVPCALPGAVMPDGMQIKPTTMRGVESQGMLCSAQELGLSQDHSGLLMLPTDAPIGANLREYLALDDQVFELKLTPNRPDCLGVYGIARELAAVSGAPLKVLDFPKAAVSIGDRLPVTISAPDLCGRFAGRIIRGVNPQAATPSWLKTRLEHAGQRSISALVDISNYVMLELGRPTHVFDLDKISGGLEVRWGRSGESLKLLNGTTIALDADVGVIADAKQVESLAGIMGGDASAVSDSTRNIYVEAAFWWPKSVAGRARRFNFVTDAGHRFERGVDAESTADHLEYLTQLILDICGGQAGPLDDQIVALPLRLPVTLRCDRARAVIGADISNAQMADCFSRLGLSFEQFPDRLVVQPPSYRFDLEIEEDLIEEVVRIWGFERLPVRAPTARIQMMPSPEAHRSHLSIKRQVAARDYQEVINYSFVDAALDLSLSAQPPIKLLNPIAAPMSVMRTTLFTSLLQTLTHNLNRKANRVRVFELGRTYFRDRQVMAGPLSVQGIAQPWRLALLSYGPIAAEQWGLAERQVDFFDLKGDLEVLLSGLDVRFEACSPENPHPALHPGRSAIIWLADQRVGVLGSLHPAIQQKLDLPQAPMLAELDVAALTAPAIPVFSEFSRFPVVIRDLAFVVADSISVAQVFTEIDAAIAATPVARLVRNVKLFDEYRGKGLEYKEKSLAFRFWMQDTGRTLSDAEVAQVLSEISTRVTEKLAARLRT